VVTNFTENAIPIELLTGNIESYETFLAARRILMAEKMRKYYEAL